MPPEPLSGVSQIKVRRRVF